VGWRSSYRAISLVNGGREVEDELFAGLKLRELKRSPGKVMTILGSGTIVNKLTDHGLIDEYQFRNIDQITSPFCS
jgi:dihydrofolate reductase